MHSWMDLIIGFLAGGGTFGLAAWAISRRRPSEGSGRAAGGPRLKAAAPVTEAPVNRPRVPVAAQEQVEVATAEAGTSIEWSVGTLALGTVTRFTGSPQGKREEVVFDPRLRDGVLAFLHGAPALASAAGQLLTNSYTLRFTAEASKGLANGSLSMMRSLEGGIRGNVINEKRRVVAQASLDSMSKAGAAALAVWQVLAIVTAQKFLADINKRLASIERGISDVKQWLEQERLGRIQGNFSYLKQLVEAVQRRDLTDTDIAAFTAQLESIERESQQIMVSAELPLDQCFTNFKQMPLTGMWLKDHSRAAQEAVVTFEQRAKEFHLAAFVRGAAIQVRSALPLTQGVARLRLDELGADLQRQAERQKAFLEIVSERIPELKGEFSWDSTDAEHQQELRSLLYRAECNVAEDSQSLSEALQTLKVRLQLELDLGSEPLELVATLDATGALARLERVLTP